MDEFNSIDTDMRVYEENKEQEADETGPDEGLYDCDLPDLEESSHAAVLEALEVEKKYSLFEDIYPSFPLGIAALYTIFRTVESNRSKVEKQTTLFDSWMQ